MTLLPFLAVGQPLPAAAAEEFTNGGFESGDLTGWARSSVLASVTTSDAGMSAAEGSFFALLRSGLGEGSTTSVSAVFHGWPGDVVSGSAFFKTDDSLPHNDRGQVVISREGIWETPFQADVASVGDGGSTTWMPWSFVIPSEGNYTIEGYVSDLGSGGTNGVSYLGLDDVMYGHSTTTTSLTLSPTSVQYGNDVTLTATVSPTAVASHGQGVWFWKSADNWVTSTPVTQAMPTAGVARAYYSVVDPAGTMQFRAVFTGGSPSANSTSDPVALTVTKRSQFITVTTPPPISALYGSQFTVAATAYSTLPVTYAGSGACVQLSGGTFRMTSGTGVCTVTFSQAGDDRYSAATPQTRTTNARKETQTISASVPSWAAFGEQFTIAASATSGLPVTYSSTGVCTNSGAVFTMTSGGGTCTVLLSQAGNDVFYAVAITKSVTAQRAAQTINVTVPAPESAAYGSQFTVAATATSGLPITYASDWGDLWVCSNSGPVFTMTSGTGDCTVTLTQRGDANFHMAVLTETVVAAKADQVITITTHAPPSATYGSQFTVAATATSGWGVGYTSSGACTNAGAVFTITSATETCTVTFSQPGNSNDVNAAPPLTETVNPSKADQTITVTAPAPWSAVYGRTFTVAATATSNLPVTYTSSGGCTNAGALFTMTAGTGTCSVTFSQTGDDNFNPTSTSASVAGQRATQMIYAPGLPTSAPYGSQFSVWASASSRLPVTYTSSGMCTNSGRVFTMTSGTGICYVHMTQVGDSNFDYTYAGTLVYAYRAYQTINVTTAAPSSAAFGTQFTVTATATSNLPVAYASSGACTNSGAVFTMTSGTGACTVTFAQPGNSNVYPAPLVTQTVSAAKADQTVLLTLGDRTLGDAPFTIMPTSVGGSGNAVMYSSSGPCSVVGDAVTVVDVGTCAITAEQAGNDNYNPSPQASTSFAIALPAPNAPSSIESNFNAVPIAADRYIWFNAHITGMTGVGERTTWFAAQTVTVMRKRVPIAVISIPAGAIHYDADASRARTEFVDGHWETTVPVSQTGNVFVTGLLFPVSQISPFVDLAASNPVTWSGQVSMPPGSTVKWQWGAAVYTSEVAPENLGVLSVKTDGLQAGTPLNLTTFLGAGARGGGGKNYTGSWSGTAHVAAVDDLEVRDSASG